MHRRSEYGVAAHWKYKEESVFGNRVKDGSGPDMAWLRQLVDWQREASDPAEFLESLRFDLAGAEVYVFTPRGEVIAAISASGPSYRLSRKRAREIVPDLAAAAAELSAQLGYVR